MIKIKNHNVNKELLKKDRYYLYNYKYNYN